MVSNRAGFFEKFEEIVQNVSLEGPKTHEATEALAMKLARKHQLLCETIDPARLINALVTVYRGHAEGVLSPTLCAIKAVVQMEIGWEYYQVVERARASKPPHPNKW